MPLRVLPVLFLILLPHSGTASSQTTRPHTKHPKIAIVLEGGSALGLAHIGVLRWLEEHHIPVDYVAGTSMGGLIGGAYATGYSPQAIDELIQGIDWDSVLVGRTSYADLTFRRKEDQRQYPNGLEFGARDGIAFPEGFNAGHEVGLVLDRIALPYSNVASFDELPIPFACVGVDLVTSQEHVFRQGSLARALRSTMSLPGIFTPVRSDGHIFVDGGLLDNLPVSVAKQMGAEVVIAVHLQIAPLDPKHHLSSFGVISQSLSTLVAANELRSMQLADVLITVPLAAYNSLDFKRGNEIIQRGYAAMDSKAAVLASFSVDEAEWKEYLAQRQQRRQLPAIPEFVEVVGTKPGLAAEIEEQLALAAGEPVNTPALERELTGFTGIGRYNRIGYSLTERNGRPGLLITAEEKPYIPPIIRPIITLESAGFGNVQFSLGGRITFLDLGGLNSEWRNDVSLGSDWGLVTEYYRPLGREHRWFVAPKAFATIEHVNLYSGKDVLAEYSNRIGGGGLDLGYTFDRNSEVRLGYVIGNQYLSARTGASDLVPAFNGRVGVANLKFVRLDTDDPVIPRSGQNLEFQAQFFDAKPGAAYAFPASEVQVSWFGRINKPASVYVTAGGGTTFGHDQTGVPRFSLGGTQWVAAYGENELLTNQYYAFRLGYLREVAEIPFGGKVYVTGAYEAGKVFGVTSKTELPMDGLFGLAMKTIFGPVFIGGSIGDDGHRQFLFRLGRIF